MAPRKPVGAELRRLIGRAVAVPDSHRVAPAWPDTFQITAQSHEATVQRTSTHIAVRSRDIVPEPVRTRTARIEVEIAEPSRAGSVAALPLVHARPIATLSEALRISGDGLLVGAEPRATATEIVVPAPRQQQLAPDATPREVGFDVSVARAHQVRPVSRPRAGHAAMVEGGPFYRSSRQRVPWDRLGTERLGASWNRVLADHGSRGEMRLVGIYGPLPLGVVASVGVDEAGTASIQLAPRVMWGPVGDLAVARLEGSGRLVSSNVSRRRATVMDAR